MVKTRAFVALVIAVTLTGSATAASAGTRALPRPTGNGVNVANLGTRLDASSATARTIVDRLFFAVWTLRTLGLADISTIGDGYQLDGIGDNPDGADPLGAKDKGLHGPTIPPTTSSTPRR